MAALIETYHPRLFRFQSPAGWTEAKEAALAAIGDSVSLIDLYRVAWSLVAAVQDGHTRVIGADVLDLPSMPVLPLDVWWTGDEAVVTDVLRPELAGLRGASIEAVDGVPTADVMSRVFSRIYSDGDNEVGKREAVNEGGWARWVALLDSAPAARTLNLRWPGGREGLQRIEAVPFATFASRRRAARRSARVDTIAGVRVGVLVFDDFEDPSPQRPFSDWMDDVFEGFAHGRADALIVDLRRNGGGPTSNGAAFVSHLVQQSFRYTLGIETRATAIPMFDQTGYPASLQERFTAGVGRPVGPGRYAFDDGGYFGSGRTEPRAPVFDGPVVILIGGGTFSTASDCVAVLRRTRAITLVGEPTGGADDGNASGVTPTFPLPHSGIRVQLPLLAFHVAEARPGEVGVMPDDLVVRTAADVREERDPALERARQTAVRLGTDRASHVGSPNRFAGPGRHAPTRADGG